MTFELHEAAQILARTPMTVDALLRDLPAAWTHANECGYTWSPFDIVGHFIHGEKTDWIPRARIILAQGTDKGFAPFDRFAQEEESAGRQLSQLLDEFAHLRLGNLAALEALDIGPEQLAWTGEHPEFGTVTLAELLATWVVHDLGHLAQISRVMARRYAKEAGPWRQYLPILGPLTE